MSKMSKELVPWLGEGGGVIWKHALRREGSKSPTWSGLDAGVSQQQQESD